jgi:hypothetical protein
LVVLVVISGGPSVYLMLLAMPPTVSANPAERYQFVRGCPRRFSPASVRSRFAKGMLHQRQVGSAVTRGAHQS